MTVFTRCCPNYGMMLSISGRKVNKVTCKECGTTCRVTWIPKLISEEVIKR